MLIDVPKEIKTQEYRVGTCREQSGLAEGINIHDGLVTCHGVAEAHGLPYTALPFAA